jgi:hypothetical protein
MRPLSGARPNRVLGEAEASDSQAGTTRRDAPAMNTDAITVSGPEGHVACPVCDGLLAFRADADALDCTGCGVVLVLAPDPVPAASHRLPIAA